MTREKTRLLRSRSRPLHRIAHGLCIRIQLVPRLRHSSKSAASFSSTPESCAAAATKTKAASAQICVVSVLGKFCSKVSVKGGRSNAALHKSLAVQLPRFGNNHVVYCGADVNHPSKREGRSPSIVAIGMSSNWRHANHYVVKIQCQKKKCEEYTAELGDMCKELLNEYRKSNKEL